MKSGKIWGWNLNALVPSLIAWLQTSTSGIISKSELDFFIVDNIKYFKDRCSFKWKQMTTNMRNIITNAKYFKDQCSFKWKQITKNRHYHLIESKTTRYLQNGTRNKDNIFSICIEIELDKAKFSEKFLTD